VIGASGDNLTCPQVGCIPGYLATDPARAGHYAFLMDNGTHAATDGAGGSGYAIYVTTDGGATWAKTATLSEKPADHHSRPWLAFGRNGELGAMWRSDVNGKLDVYAAVSLDGGLRFSRATKVNEGSGPYTPTGFPDDNSAIAIGANRVYVAWGDARKGNTAVMFASVPLSRFLSVPTSTCAKPSGSLTGAALGRLRLGMTTTASRRALERFTVTHNGFANFCLYHGWGIRAGYPSTRLLGELNSGRRAVVAGGIVLLLTANRYYRLGGIAPGAALTASLRARFGKPFRIGTNDWYVAVGSPAADVLKVRGGVVQEVGIANGSLMRTRVAQKRLLASFPNV
jgi:hypothetical protein